ncbi:MAG TPA: hypothetical protein PKN61_11040 [Acidobacteriota bacterium]|jgi:hypothetical protein|nr:hypothetical protein [Acidobacteriota bacterium]HNR39561.1 hypothetical protein [Acidobacteriota bacterium]HNU00240.1 hypothetical protein [Acidobacteriota bacterium]HPB29033.1 hypothetical protein [Acidobacteriota bacterium]HQO26308.1 hypothetical protein [Acidobacteriota bacterium]
MIQSVTTFLLMLALAFSLGAGQSGDQGSASRLEPGQARLMDGNVTPPPPPPPPPPKS